MQRLFALFALLSLVLAPLGVSAASAAPAREPCSAMQRHKAPDASTAEHACCTPALSPLPDVPAAAPPLAPPAPPGFVARVDLLPPLDSPPFELPPPRNG